MGAEKPAVIVFNGSEKPLNLRGSILIVVGVIIGLVDKLSWFGRLRGDLHIIHHRPNITLVSYISVVYISLVMLVYGQLSVRIPAPLRLPDANRFPVGWAAIAT